MWLIHPPTEYSRAPPRAGFLLNQCYDRSVGTYPMSEEQLKAFLEKVKDVTSLQEKLKTAASPEAAIEIAKAAGFSITPADIQSMQSATAELSDEELEGVAGGMPLGPTHEGDTTCY